jgi:hypothetical protein
MQHPKTVPCSCLSLMRGLQARFRFLVRLQLPTGVWSPPLGRCLSRFHPWVCSPQQRRPGGTLRLVWEGDITEGEFEAPRLARSGLPTRRGALGQ